MMSLRQATVAGVALFGAAIAVYASSDSPMTGEATSQKADPSVVAVFPFAVDSSQTALVDLRAAIQDLVVAELPGGDGGPRAVDPTVIGTGQVLRGTIGGTPNAMSIDAALMGVPDRAIRARARVRGNADSIPYLTERLVAHLLAGLAARDSDELEAFRQASPSAFRAYLAGVHAHRLGRTGASSEATRHFERALFLDSTFTLAALRLAERAAVYGTAELDERWKFDAIWKQRHRLGPPDRALLTAYVGPRYPRPATLAELIAAAESAAVEAPNRAEGWHVLGEHLLRYGLEVGHPDWETQAGYALKRAYALDSTDASTVSYLLLLAIRAGDTAAVRHYAQLHSALHPVGSPGQFSESFRWIAATALRDSSALKAVRSRFDRMPRLSFRSIIDWSQTLGLGLDDAEHARRVLTERDSSGAMRRFVVMGLVPYLLNRGRPHEASRLLATAEQGFGQRSDVGALELRIYAALFWDGDSSNAAAAVASLEAYLDGALLLPGQVRDRATAACALAHWRIAAGEYVLAEKALARMRRLLAKSDANPIESLPVCAASAEAQLTAAQRLPNAATVLERLDTLLRGGFNPDLFLPTVANVVAGRLYEARGQRLHALALTRRRAYWWPQFLSTQLREEGRLATLLGDYPAAINAYRHYLALRSDPEPQLRADAERARAALAALTAR